jgi:hypothetical protein
MITINKEQQSQDAVWLNEDEPLEMIPKSRRRQTERFNSLIWLPGNRFVEGVSYDVSHCNLHPIKASIMGYAILIRRIGINIVKQVEVTTLPEVREHRNDVISHYLHATRGSEALCDMSIIIGARMYYMHLLILANLLLYFKRRETESVNESRNVLSPDMEILYEYASCATEEIVPSVIEWVNNGHLEVDDRILANDVESINRCLDRYLNVLRPAHLWDIQLLKPGLATSRATSMI